MSSVAIVGAGNYGTALAHVLSRNKHRVKLLTIDEDVERVFRKTLENSLYLPGVKFEKKLVTVTLNLEESVRDATAVFIAVPIRSVQAVLVDLKDKLRPDAALVMTSKGMIGDGLTMSNLVDDALPTVKRAGLYGITFSRLLTLENGLSSMCIAAKDAGVRREVAKLFAGLSGLKVVTSHDEFGAEFGGAMKNVYAIMMGLTDGYFEWLGDSLPSGAQEALRAARSSVLNACIIEFLHLGSALGAQMETLLSACGVGDIIASSNPHSRNYRWGLWCANVELKKLPGNPPELHEGVQTVRAAYVLAAKHKITAPILQATYEIVCGDAQRSAQVIPPLLEKLCEQLDVSGRGDEHKIEEQFAERILKLMG